MKDKKKKTKPHWGKTIIEVNERIDRIVDAVDKSKRVKGM